jgi:hypothetical protein
MPAVLAADRRRAETARNGEQCTVTAATVGAGQGEEWLSDCANGPLSTSEGVGGPSEWLPAGSLQHMTYVVRSLPGG